METYKLVNLVRDVFDNYKIPIAENMETLKDFDEKCNEIKFARDEIISLLYEYSILRSSLFEDGLRWVLNEFPHKDKTYEDYNLHENTCKEFAHRINLWIKAGCIGNIYSFDEFYSIVKTGGFIDYDGSGEFIDEDGNKIAHIHCNCDWLVNNKPDNCNYVMWYNK